MKPGVHVPDVRFPPPFPRNFLPYIPPRVRGRLRCLDSGDLPSTWRLDCGISGMNPPLLAGL